VLRPYQGQHMADGVHSRSLPIGDPAFFSHNSIEAELGDAWRHIELPGPLSRPTRDLATKLGYELPHDRASLEAPHEEFFIQVRDLKLCACAWGPEDGPPIVCLHGILDQGFSWELVARPLADEGYRVIAPDLRGHGLSDHVGKGGSYHILDFVADVDGIVQKVADKPFVLVGHSMGAAIAGLYAGARPARVSSLILVELPRAPQAKPANMAEAFAMQLDYLAKPRQHPVFKSVEEAAERRRRGMRAIPSGFALRAVRRLTEPCDGGVRWRWDPLLGTRAGLGFDAAVSSPEMLQEMLARIPAPVTMVYGDSAGHLPLPQAKHIVLPHGHNLHIEAAGRLSVVIAEAIARQALSHTVHGD
jgi:pimeloyl-ACP methyl ester carboxylesterase